MLFAEQDRPARAQLLAALLLGIALIAAGLYLWRRPHAADAASIEAASASALAMVDDAAVSPPAADAGSASPVALSEARVLGCHDRGPKATPPDLCDHVTSVEQALARAIERSAACVPPSGSASTIEYVADVSFSRRKVRLSLPRAGRSLRDRKVVGACAAAVRGGIQDVPLDSADHQHARYKISMTATYRAGT